MIKDFLIKNKYHLIEAFIIVFFCIFAVIFSGNVILTDDELGNIGFVKKEFGLGDVLYKYMTREVTNLPFFAIILFF